MSSRGDWGAREPERQLEAAAPAVALLSTEATDDEDSSSLLREAVVRRVHDSPLHLVAEVGQGSEHHCEVTTSLPARRLEESIDVLEEQVLDGPTGDSSTARAGGSPTRGRPSCR